MGRVLYIDPLNMSTHVLSTFFLLQGFKHQQVYTRALIHREICC